VTWLTGFQEHLPKTIQCSGFALADPLDGLAQPVGDASRCEAFEEGEAEKLSIASGQLSKRGANCHPLCVGYQYAERISRTRKGCLG
jgi:hypothetical protein